MSLLRSARFPAIVLLVAAVARTDRGELARRRRRSIDVHARVRRHPRRRSSSRSRTGSRTACSRSSSSSVADRAAVRADAAASSNSAAQGAAAGDRRRRRRARADRDLPRDRRGQRTPRRAGRSRPRPTSPSRSGVLAIFGRGLPSAVRIFLLALAILDDIVGHRLHRRPVRDGRAISGCWRCAARRRRRSSACSAGSSTRRGRVPIAIAAGRARASRPGCSCCQSGVHATIAGVALGLAMAQRPGAARAARARAVGERRSCCRCSPSRPRSS